MEFDGFVDYKIAVTARRDVAVSDIRLEVPWSEGAAKYMMGLGHKGGLRPATFDWAWDQKKNQDALWLGTVNAGMQVALRAENYSRPLNTNFYLSKPLAMPPSWWNDGKGKVTVTAEAPAAVRLESPVRGHDRELRRAHGPVGRDAPFRLHAPHHAVQAARPGGPLRRALLPRFQAARRGRGDGRQRRQRPPRQRHQSLHQLSLPARARDEGLRRRRPRARAQGQDLRHHPRALQPRARALRAAQPGPRDLLAGPGRRLLLAPGAPRRRLYRGLVRPRSQGRRGHQQRHVALAQLLHRGARLGGARTSASTGSTSTTSPSTGRP